ncbi:6052_t:CDS:1, partial [Gigaspora margarita]
MRLPLPELIIVTHPRSSILSPQHHPTQNLAEEHQIPIVNTEIEKTDK